MSYLMLYLKTAQPYITTINTNEIGKYPYVSYSPQSIGVTPSLNVTAHLLRNQTTGEQHLHHSPLLPHTAVQQRIL